MCYYHQHASRLVCLSLLPACLSNFNGGFRSQGKYRATLEFKSFGCAVSSNLIYDSSLSQSYIVCTLPPYSAGGEVEPPTKLKKGGLDRTSTLRGE